MMIHSTIGCFKSVFFVMVLFGAMLYIFGIAFTSAFIDHMSELSMWQELGWVPSTYPTASLLLAKVF